MTHGIVAWTRRRRVSGLPHALLISILLVVVSIVGVSQAQSDEDELSAFRRQLEETQQELAQVKDELAVSRTLVFELELVIELATRVHNTLQASLTSFWVDLSAEKHVEWVLYCFKQERKFFILYFSDADAVEYSSEQLALYESIGDAILAEDTEAAQELMLRYCSDTIVPLPNADDVALKYAQTAGSQSGAKTAELLQETCWEREAKLAVAYRLGSGSYESDQVVRYTQALENEDDSLIREYCADLVSRLGTEYMARIAELD